MSAGTIKLTNGSTAVVGTSTTFTTDLKSGDVITTTIGGVFYTLFVDTVTSATALTLSEAFTGPTTTGAAYVAVPAQTMSRIPAQLAILTQEAVRRVLQENVNWQAFYSGTGDITITLPNGTPTGLQISGPSWAKLSGIANTTWIDRGRIPDGSNINTFNPSTTEGTWHISGIGTVTTANGFPPGAQRGTLTIINGGWNSGMEIYVDQAANQWGRSLTAAWNGTDGPWGDWIKTGTGAMADIGLGISTQPTLTAFDWQQADFFSGQNVQANVANWLNAPAGLNNPSGDVVNIICDGARTANNRWAVRVVSQSFTASSRYEYRVVINGAKGSRTFNVIQEFNSDPTTLIPLANGGLGANTPAGGRAALGFDGMGIGLSSLPALASFDWQQADFTTGSTVLVTFSKMTNVPTGLTYSADVAVFIRVVGISGTSVSLELFSDTTVDAPYNIYEVLVRGAKAARTFTVRRVFSSADVVPLANGGTGATTAAAARTNLGLKGASILDVGTAAGTVAAGNDSRLIGALQPTGGNVNGSLVLNAPGAYWQNTAAARYAVSTMTYLDIFRFSQVDIGGVGTSGVLQFVANPGNYLSFDLSPGNGSHSFRHDGKIVTNAGTVAFVSSDGRIKDKKGKPKGSAQDRIRALASTATQDYLWLNYQGDFNTYRYEQPQRGFIAQDAWEVDPAYASKPQSGADDEMPENGDAIWGVNTNAIVADMVLAFEEQQTDIEGLRQTVADQQAQIAQLTSAIEQLSQQIQALSQPAAQS